jgi:ABC-type lipoprotein release transport system permease subunit
MPRVVVAVRGKGGIDTATLKTQIVSALPVEPLEVRSLDDEMERLGSDMYVFLARENVRIYLIGGLILALVGILAVATANYADNRRTLGLLRIRGCGPAELFRFFAPGIVAPSLVGFVLGAGVALAVGYGITHIIWNLREIQTVLNYLVTHLAVSWTTAIIAFVLIIAIAVTASVFSVCAFRHSAREGLNDR